MVQKSQGQPPGMVLKPHEYCETCYINWLARFLNHQRYLWNLRGITSLKESHPSITYMYKLKMKCFGNGKFHHTGDFEYPGIKFRAPLFVSPLDSVLGVDMASTALGHFPGQHGRAVKKKPMVTSMIPLDS